MQVWFRNLMRSTASSEAEQIESTITDNISSTGCYFVVQQAPPVGTEVEMEITIPAVKDGRVRCRGKIVRLETTLEEGKTGVACTIDQYRIV
jgi:hypothetical protein